MRSVIKRTPVHDGSGCAVHTALAGSPQEPVQHRLDVAGLNPLLHGGPQPRGCMVMLGGTPTLNTATWLVMLPKLFAVSPRPMRPFQGWRYLDAKTAPPDLGSAAESIARMPEPMKRELRELGLL